MAELAEVIGETQELIKTVRVAIPKAGKDAFIEVDYENTPIEVHMEAIMLGYKELLNRKMTKLKSTKDMTGKQLEEQKAAIMKQAEANLQDCMEGKIRVTGGKQKEKAAGPEVMALAKKIALRAIKDKIKNDGGKIGNYKPATLTAAAKQLIEINPAIVDQAKSMILEQQKVAGHVTGGIDVGSLEVDPEKKAESDAKAAAKQAKQAKTPPKKKEAKAQHAQH